ncbi:hypothetical protein G6F68_013306 [Rhizopus microsporus]|nr:hypothetical protein G6F68_013306 [Rhizopus microsporus]
MSQRHAHHRQQEQHDDVGLVQYRKGQHRQARGRRAIAQRPGVAGQWAGVAFVAVLACPAPQRERVAAGSGAGGQGRGAQPDDVDFGAARGQHVGEAGPAP